MNSNMDWLGGVRWRSWPKAQEGQGFNKAPWLLLLYLKKLVKIQAFFPSCHASPLRCTTFSVTAVSNEICSLLNPRWHLCLVLCHSAEMLGSAAASASLQGVSATCPGWLLQVANRAYILMACLFFYVNLWMIYTFFTWEKYLLSE